MKKFLFLIIVAAVFVRLFYLGRTPLALEWDEVALGYDAYSILNTGKDQFGQILPFTFRSLDDYKPPLYVYATVPSILTFGLNEFSTRLPSALFGIGSVFLTYILSLIIFSNIKNTKTHAIKIALTSAFLLSISPWHLQFSRAAFEANISVFITITAATFFLIGLRNPKFFLLAAAFFGLDLFAYHSTRVVAPLLMTGLFILFSKHLPARKYNLSFALIFFIFFLIFIPILTSKDAQIRFKATNIFTPGVRYTYEKDLGKVFLKERIKDAEAGFTLAGKIFHNQRLVFLDYETLVKAFKNYISNFGFEYLFIKGDAPLHHAPKMGLLYIVELPFILIGIYSLWKKGFNRYSLIIPLWIILSPIPNAVTREAPNAIRTELILPMYQILTAYGLVVSVRLIKRQVVWVYLSLIIGLVGLFILNISSYLHQYYVHTNYDLAKNWMYGRKEAAKLTEELKEKYDKIIISPRLESPHIFWLFYLKYDPAKYLKEGGTISGGFAEDRNKFDKYEFRYFDYHNLPKDQKLLLVGTSKGPEFDFPGDANIINTIYNPDGTVAIEFAENKK